MHASASGPVGALLLIAPLAAIPVFAVIGVPQFAPVVASATDDGDVQELGPASSLSVDAASSPSKRTADDLFAPVSGVSSTMNATPGMGLGDRFPGKADLGPGRRGVFGDSDNSRTDEHSPPSEALDDWQVIPAPHTGRNTVSEDTSNRRESSEDRVSTDQFSRDLLNPSASSIRLPKANPRSIGDDGRESGGANRLGNESQGLEGMLPTQSGWIAASRRLRQLGINKYRLDPPINERQFVFSCVVNPNDNPRVIQRFEDTADDPLEAVQKVIQQVEEWQRRSGRATRNESVDDRP